jgi:hypothetical protein
MILKRIDAPNVRMVARVIVLLQLFMRMALFSSAQVYVAPNGNDQNAGTIHQPIASFKKAQQLVRKMKGTGPIQVIFKSGTYYLPETVHFTVDDSKKNGVIFQAEQEGTVVISGGKKLSLSWKPYSPNVFVADVQDLETIDQLFVNDVRQRMARYPNTQEGKNVYDAWDLSHTIKVDSLNDVLLPSRVNRWQDPTGAYLHAMHHSLWGDMHWVVKGKDQRGELILEGGWQNNRPSKMHPVYRMVENVFEELDAPGEWFFHATQRKLYYFPDKKVDLKTATVEVVQLKHLIEFNGTADKPVRNIHLKGFVFKHTARTFMDNKEPLQRSDWTVYRGGAVMFNGAENCFITGCEFSAVGGNSVFVNHYNRNIVVRSCYIHHSGASGILFVGDSAAVRSPIYGYVKRDYALLDTVKGPRSQNYPSDCLVEDCLITLTGRDEKQTAGVHLSVSANIRINHCSIYDMPRAGININEGTFGGHIIENSDVFNTVLETGDHGSFNSWGRDRYWTGDGREVVKAMEKSPDLYLLDMLAPNIIRNNRWRCDHGWDIDLDDGSSQYRIYNNVLLNRGLKLREGYDRIVTNNIMLNNSLHPHVWYTNSGDVFKYNIVFGAYRPAIMNKVISADGKWGKVIDSNLFVCDAVQMHRFLKHGCDSNSMIGDPIFENAEMGNYRVKKHSPALAIGFRNFETGHFGVQSARLKAMAKRPVFPPISMGSVPAVANGNQSVRWMGAILYEPKGDELSAMGVGFQEGGVALTLIEANSSLLKFGFKSGDMIQAINGVAIKTIENFQAFLGSASGGEGSFLFELVRDQQKQRLLVKAQLNRLYN